jgi:4-hydroxybenzoate polyprenyltransferase
MSGGLFGLLTSASKDLSDAAGDAAAGQRTAPIRYGKTRVRPCSPA